MRATKSSPLTSPGRPLLILLCMAALTWLSWSGCAPRMVVVMSDHVEQPIKAGATFTATNGGVFMGWARYEAYRRAVADRILEEQSK